METKLNYQAETDTIHGDMEEVNNNTELATQQSEVVVMAMSKYNSVLPTISQLVEIEKEIVKLPPVDMPVTHHFSKGVYARELFIPKGTILTGKIHKYENLNIMISGELSVSTEEGIKRVKAPFIVVSPPGTKRIAYAHEDTRWITIHGTEEKDVDEIEKVFIAQTEQEYLTFVDEQRLIEDQKGGALCLGEQ